MIIAFVHPFLDVAIFVLSENANLGDGVNISAVDFSDDFLQKNPYFYNIGYGCEVGGFINLKKAKLPSQVAIYNDGTHDHLKFVNNYLSNGDSGGPILFRDPANPNNIQLVGIVAIINGPNPYMNQELFDWIKFVSTKAAEMLENPDSSQTSDSQSIPPKITEKSQD